VGSNINSVIVPISIKSACKLVFLKFETTTLFIEITSVDDIRSLCQNNIYLYFLEKACIIQQGHLHVGFTLQQTILSMTED